MGEAVRQAGGGGEARTALGTGAQVRIEEDVGNRLAVQASLQQFV